MFKARSCSKSVSVLSISCSINSLMLLRSCLGRFGNDTDSMTEMSHKLQTMRLHIRDFRCFAKRLLLVLVASLKFFLAGSAKRNGRFVETFSIFLNLLKEGLGAVHVPQKQEKSQRGWYIVTLVWYKLVWNPKRFALHSVTVLGHTLHGLGSLRFPSDIKSKIGSQIQCATRIHKLVFLLSVFWYMLHPCTAWRLENACSERSQTDAFCTVLGPRHFEVCSLKCSALEFCVKFLYTLDQKTN